MTCIKVSTILNKLTRFLASTGRTQTFDYNNNSEYMTNGSYDYSKIKSASGQFFDTACSSDVSKSH